MFDPVTSQIKENLDGMGEQRVRRNLQAGGFNDQEMRVAESWLKELDDSPTIRLSRDNLRIAKSAKTAAWTAAIAAIAAAIISTVAAVITFLAWLHPHL